MTSDIVHRHPLKEKRRANKPLLERKRRARINDSLCDLKHLVLTSLNKDVSKFSKMEKVDILDMTVQFLKGRCQENLNSVYQRGYTEGSKDILFNILSMNNIDQDTKRKINTQLQEHTPPPSPVAYPAPPSPVAYPGIYHQPPSSLSFTSHKSLPCVPQKSISPNKYILPHPAMPILKKSNPSPPLYTTTKVPSVTQEKSVKSVWRPW